MRTVRLEGGARIVRSPRLAALGVPHAFTSRVGVANEPLDAGGLGEAPEELLRALAGIASDARLADARQVHGARVLEVDGATPASALAADALVTASAARWLLVRTADCVPVLLARTDGARVAAVHAGWRGLVAGVLPATVEALGPGAFVAAIGPCLSTARFEVGPEVAEAFAAADLGELVFPGAGDRSHVDLRGAARLQLARGGVLEVDVDERCTFDRADELYSYRRDVRRDGERATGRLAAIIAPRGAAATPSGGHRSGSAPV